MTCIAGRAVSCSLREDEFVLIVPAAQMCLLEVFRKFKVHVRKVYATLIPCFVFYKSINTKNEKS